MTVFGELDYRMSVVERWSVVLTIQRQNLATHSYNVANIAHGVAIDWFGITSERVLYQILRLALNHDKKETITGDFPSYMKPFVDEDAAIGQFIEDDALAEPWDVGTEWNIVRVIVKIADYLDALIFLRMEISLGNKSVAHHLRAMEARFKRYLEEQDAERKGEGGAFKPVFDLYLSQIVTPLFNDGRGFVSEQHGFEGF